MRPFAKEEPDPTRARVRPWSFHPLALLTTSGLGLILAIVAAVRPSPWSLARLLAQIPWLITLFVALIDRPRKTPKTLLALFTAILASELAALAAERRRGQGADPLHVLITGIAFVAIIVILRMPMRDPGLPEPKSEKIANCCDPPKSDFRSPEDNLTLWQFMTVSWLKPLINRGFGTQLNDDDVWTLPYDFQHDRLYTLFRDLPGSSLIRRLLWANGLDLMIITLLGTVEAVAKLSLPMLLQLLLQSIKRGPSHLYGSLYYAALTMIVRLIAAQSAVFNTWFSRRAYERSRGEMLTTIYNKTLTRKSVGAVIEETNHGNETENGTENGAVNGAVNGDASGVTRSDEPDMPLLGHKKTNPRKSCWVRLLEFLRLRKSDQKKPESKAEQPATMGKILNLMKNDVYQVAQRFWEFPTIVTKPLQLILSLVLVWKLLGWSCLFGIAWVVIVQVANAACVRWLIVNEKLRRAATDVRLQVTSQFVEAIRHLRWYDWQSKWLENIMDARHKELRKLVVTGLFGVGIAATNFAAAALFPVFTFFAYTYIAGNSLPVEVAFPALQLFTMLEQSLKEVPALITTLLNASIAMGRLNAFMEEPDKEEGDDHDTQSEIGFENATLAWPGHRRPVLKDLLLSFSTGLTVICGKVGSGKTALLQGILGELDLLHGRCSLPNEMVGYCAQAPWLQNMSIRDNILFNFAFDLSRYKKVLDACALITDLANFKHGDLTNIGENGVGLSGGQKARVALARALYSRSRILLLDDPIAALDHHTAESIVRKLFQESNSLIQGRTVILVTHRVDICTQLAVANQIVEIEDGKAHILEPNENPREIEMLAKEQDISSVPRVEDPQVATDDQEGTATPDKFIEDEARASGAVVARVYWTYIKAGKLRSWALLIGIYALFRSLMVFNGWFLKSWGEAYEGIRAQNVANWMITVQIDAGPTITTANATFEGSMFFDGLPNPENDVKPWLMWYAAIGLVTTFLSTLSQCGLLLILYVAAKDLFARVIKRVSNATFRFYDVTPIGRLMNRLTSDIGMIDGGIIQPLQDVAFHALTWISSMVVIAWSTSLFLVFALGLTGCFFMIFRRFLPTSQSLRRLEMVSLSPLMSNFGILVDGLATIRAFKAQPHFQKRNIAVTDAFQKMDHFFWSLQAWLTYRFDTLSALSTFLLTVLALYQGLSPGLTAFVLTTSSQFVDATHALCKVYGQLQMDFVSVERVVELLDVEQEPEGDLTPPASWPSHRDDIEFDNVTLRYAPHLEPSLSNVSFVIPCGSKCAVLGRTGSGKSTLALALLATIHPEAGSIRVGSIDMAHVDVHTWRQRISFVAQDPVLFPGTLRQNLDPLSEYTESECDNVLGRVLGPGWGSGSRIDGGGRNLSQGQRQLVGIGRAVLRRSPVVVLDEATASIDKRTAAAIQQVLHEELRYSTVITIAHRLEAVRDANYFIRLEAGRVVEAGPCL
ncbi:hypothetical protein SLS62_005245 [Diatrype stigma]|uniref:ABC transporter n=1 Tax=Diatrype stigma TaxID=117547 RepID=A0AAN9V389_9PEZI